MAENAHTPKKVLAMHSNLEASESKSKCMFRLTRCYARLSNSKKLTKLLEHSLSELQKSLAIGELYCANRHACLILQGTCISSLKVNHKSVFLKRL